MERTSFAQKWMLNEYKDYLLGIVFYKYLSDLFMIKVYDLTYDEKPEILRVALEAYKEALEDESAEELKEQIKSDFHYVIEPELTYTCLAETARNNSFNREQLQKAFNNIEQSDSLFADLFTEVNSRGKGTVYHYEGIEGSAGSVVEGTTNTYQDTFSGGIDVTMYIDSNGKIISAFHGGN